PFDLVLAMTAPVLGQYRPGRVASNDLDVGIALLEITPHTSDRTTGSRRRYKVRDLAFSLLPQLRTRRRVVRVRIGLIVELIRENRVGRLLRAALRHHHVVVGMVRRNGGRCHDHFRTESLEQAHLFLRHLVGQREDALVAAQCGRDREANTSVAASPLHDRSARLELSLALGALDDREPDTVLDRSARIEELSLAVDGRANPASHTMQPDQRRPSNRLENVVVRPLISLY